MKWIMDRQKSWEREYKFYVPDNDGMDNGQNET